MNKVKSIIYPVKNVDSAKNFFSKLLGMEPTNDSPYYVGFTTESLEIGLDPNGHSKGMTGGVAYYNVENIKEHIETLSQIGATVHNEPMDIGGGALMALMIDKEGNMFGLIQPA